MGCALTTLDITDNDRLLSLAFGCGFVAACSTFDEFDVIYCLRYEIATNLLLA